jgi:hypothetical protein
MMQTSADLGTHRVVFQLESAIVRWKNVHSSVLRRLMRYERYGRYVLAIEMLDHSHVPILSPTIFEQIVFSLM